MLWSGVNIQPLLTTMAADETRFDDVTTLAVDEHEGHACDLIRGEGCGLRLSTARGSANSGGRRNDG